MTPFPLNPWHRTRPGTVERVARAFRSVLEAQRRLVPVFHGGTALGFYHVWAPGPSIWWQDDLSAILSPKVYREFFLDSARLILAGHPHTAFHLHPASFFIIDELLSVEGLKVIEVNKDIGGPSVKDMLPVLSRIMQSRGLILWGDLTIEELEVVKRNLPCRGLCLNVIAPSIEQAHERRTYIQNWLERLLGNTVQAMGHPLRVSAPNQGLMPYRLDCLNPDEDLDAIAEGLRRDPRGRFCLYGPPGSGKSAFGDYLARTLDRPLLLKRGSDLLSKWVGETEQHIARMFREAERQGAVLLLDEADSFLQERTGAHHRWEVTQVNELITRMEAFDGLFIAATNLIDTFDVASLRRFDLKVRFDYLRPAQAWVLFREVLTDRGSAGTDQTAVAPAPGVPRCSYAGGLRHRGAPPAALPETPDRDRLFILLAKEVAFKRSRPQRGIGFTAEV